MSERPVREWSDGEIKNFMRHGMHSEGMARDKWDRLYPDGEGTVPDGFLSSKAGDRLYRGRTVQWVRIYRDRECRKAVAQFILWWDRGEPVEMVAAIARKGFPPNPFDTGYLQQFGWHTRTVGGVEPRPMTPEEQADDEAFHVEQDADSRAREDERRVAKGKGPLSDEGWAEHKRKSDERRWWFTQQMANAGWFGAMVTPGARPMIEAYPIPVRDGEPRWRFPDSEGAGFKVRVSLLAQALFMLRAQGQQRISVYLLRQTVQRLQEQ